MPLSDQRNKGVIELVTVHILDVILALVLALSVGAIWWEWYFNPKRGR